ncbi:MAG: hypothetical protein IJR83_00460 [Clostridia bacterium]|nr:hypothetical protein [Clostridia bacterium]
MKKPIRFTLVILALLFIISSCSQYPFNHETESETTAEPVMPEWPIGLSINEAMTYDEFGFAAMYFWFFKDGFYYICYDGQPGQGVVRFEKIDHVGEPTVEKLEKLEVGDSLVKVFSSVGIPQEPDIGLDEPVSRYQCIDERTSVEIVWTDKTTKESSEIDMYISRIIFFYE